MTEPNRSSRRIRPGKTLSALMDAAPAHMTLPATKADFDRLVTLAESDLQPTKRGRPTGGVRGAATRTRSIRAPLNLWSRLDQLADAKASLPIKSR